MCKISGCREQAQPYGKRLCPEHEARRKEKAKIYFAKPKCQFCGTQHTDNKNDQGIPECPTCRNARFERDLERAKKNAIFDELMICSTLDDLKAFIAVHLLEK
jgi:ribosomal protein L37AE/L43A